MHNLHNLFFVVISNNWMFQVGFFPQRCAIFDRKIIRIQDHLHLHLLRLKTFKRAMKIENIYRLEFAFAFCFRICICVFAFVKQPRPKMLAGRKNLNSQTRPNGQDLKYLTPPCVPNLPFKFVYLPWLKEKGADQFDFIHHPVYPCTQVTKIERTKYKPHPFSQGAPCETITTQATIFTKLRKWFRIQDHFLLVPLYLSVEAVDVFNTMWWVCGDGSLQVGGRKGGAGADGGESIFQRSIIRISLGTCLFCGENNLLGFVRGSSMGSITNLKYSLL